MLLSVVQKFRGLNRIRTDVGAFAELCLTTWLQDLFKNTQQNQDVLLSMNYLSTLNKQLYETICGTWWDSNSQPAKATLPLSYISTIHFSARKHLGMDIEARTDDKPTCDSWATELQSHCTYYLLIVQICRD